MTPALQVDAADTKALMRQFHRLGQAVGTRVTRKAVSAGATPIARAMRQEAPVGETGNLRRSIGRKTKGYKDHATAVAIVGPRISGKYRAYHAHLVEHGHIAADGSYVPGNPFMARAVQSSESQAINRMHDKLAQEIAKEAAK